MDSAPPSLPPAPCPVCSVLGTERVGLLLAAATAPDDEGTAALASPVRIALAQLCSQHFGIDLPGCVILMSY